MVFGDGKRGGQSSPTEYREGAKESKLPSNGQLEGIIRIL